MLYVEDMNQATKSVDIDHYELEFRQNFKTKSECLAISDFLRTDTKKKFIFFHSKTSLQLNVPALGTQWFE